MLHRRMGIQDLEQDRSETERLHLLGLFQQAPGFVCFLRGPNLVYELANTAYYRLVGHRELLGKPVREALPEVEGQGYFELLDQMYRSGEAFVGRGMRALLQREPGAAPTEVFIDLVYQPIRDAAGAVTGILVQGHDVTEAHHHEALHRHAEAALRASEQRYRSLFASIDDGFCLIELIFDAAGEPVDYRFIETNPAFEVQTGLMHAVGKTMLELVPGHDRHWFRTYGHVAVTGEATRFEDHAAAMGRWFDVYASRVGPPALRQVAVVFKDISARKRVEDERAQLLTRERAARREAEEASRLRDEFLTTVSHELRTPLTAILGWVQLLRGGRLPPDKHGRALETIERNARAQAQLIEDLLDVSSIMAGKLRLEVTAVDLPAIIEAALETVRPAAEAKGLHLRASLTADCPVMGDTQRLHQVVWNLLANAVKFTPQGGQVHVQLARHEASVEVTVTDTGVGIDPEFQPHAFRRFRQANGATTRAHGGLGLGLSIVRQLVELHGGTVRVFSEGVGRGASFTVRLPLTLLPQRAVSGPHLRVPAASELTDLHILVVDDEQDTREMLRALLEQHGARITLAASAAEALRHHRADPPDLLLSDIAMPDEDGYTLISRLRGLPPGAGGDLPAVALTAHARPEDRNRALRAGFDNHLCKPVDPQELIAVIAALSLRARQREP